MTRHVALLRGINVGAHRRIKMADLKAALATLGHDAIATVGVSGNVVLGGPVEADDIQRLIEERCGVPDVRVLVRSGDELEAVVAGNPWPERTSEGKLLHVTFLSADPAGEAKARVEAAVDGDDEVAWGDRALYVWYAGGTQGSAVAKVVTDRVLGVTATDRNWNTVAKLLDLVRSR